MPRITPTKLQLARIADAAKAAANVNSRNASPLKCQVVAALLNDPTIKVPPIFDCWDVNYQLECQRLCQLGE